MAEKRKCAYYWCIALAADDSAHCACHFGLRARQKKPPHVGPRPDSHMPPYAPPRLFERPWDDDPIWVQRDYGLPSDAGADRP